MKNQKREKGTEKLLKHRLPKPILKQKIQSPTKNLISKLHKTQFWTKINKVWTAKKCPKEEMTLKRSKPKQ